MELHLTQLQPPTQQSLNNSPTTSPLNPPLGVHSAACQHMLHSGVWLQGALLPLPEHLIVRFLRFLRPPSPTHPPSDHISRVASTNPQSWDITQLPWVAVHTHWPLSPLRCISTFGLKLVFIFPHFYSFFTFCISFPQLHSQTTQFPQSYIPMTTTLCEFISLQCVDCLELQFTLCSKTKLNKFFFSNRSFSLRLPRTLSNTPSPTI